MFRVHAATTAFAVVLLLAASAYGVVQTIDATVTSQVEQKLSDQVINSDLAFENLGETTGNLPLLAEAKLTEPTDPDTGGAANSRLADPRATQDADPAEFGIAALANIASGQSSWTASSAADETRGIVFTAGEIGQDDNTDLLARSFFYLDGILVLWHQAGSTDLSGSSAEAVIRVEQTRGDGPPVNVLTASMSLVGQANGIPTLTAGGVLTADNVILLDASALVPQLGTVQLAILPKLAIPYEYSARVGETFTLKASAEGRLQSSGRTGAAVILGPSVDEVVQLVSDVAGQDVGAALGQVLNNIIKASLTPARPLPADSVKTTVTVQTQSRLLPAGLCGALGAESAAAFLLTASLVGLVRRWRG